MLASSPMELLSYFEAHTTDHHKHLPLFVQTLAFPETENLFDMAPINEDSNQHYDTSNRYPQDDDNHPPSMTHSFTGSSSTISQPHTIHNDLAQTHHMHQYESGFKAYSPDAFHHSHQPVQFYPAVAPELAHPIPYLPQDNLGQGSSLTSPLILVPSSLYGQLPYTQPLPSQQTQQSQEQLVSNVKLELLDDRQRYNYRPPSVKQEPADDVQRFPYRQEQTSPVDMPTPSLERSDIHHYPDMTTMVNANASMAAPLVEATFVDLKRCTVCGRRITRDMTRHLRTHELTKRFTCKFSKSSCSHRSGQFNRRYDFKKHLLNKHFEFDDSRIKKVHNLSDKLNDWGTCPCGQRFNSGDWLENHVLTQDPSRRCPRWEYDGHDRYDT